MNLPLCYSSDMIHNIFESILEYGDSPGCFTPVVTSAFQPTRAPAGSPEKIEVLRKRVELGLPLWHPLDGIEDGESVPVSRLPNKHSNHRKITKETRGRAQKVMGDVG